MKFLIGTYAFLIPPGTEVVAKAVIRPIDDFGTGETVWTFQFGDFAFYIRLDPTDPPEELARFIRSATKKAVDLRPVEINGIKGMSYGDYHEGRSWIDWWLKKGELMICINLQGWKAPTGAEREVHAAVLGSLQYVGR